MIQVLFITWSRLAMAGLSTGLCRLWPAQCHLESHLTEQEGYDRLRVKRSYDICKVTAHLASQLSDAAPCAGHGLSALAAHYWAALVDCRCWRVPLPSNVGDSSPILSRNRIVIILIERLTITLFVRHEALRLRLYLLSSKEYHALLTSRFPSTMSPTRPVATISSTSNFQLIFSTALKAYERRTKTDILVHPLASQLQACNSPASILTVLQGQVEDLAQARSSDERLTKWLNPTINVLLAFSAILGNGVSLVRLEVIFSRDYAFTASTQVFSPATVIFAGAGVLLQVCIFFDVPLKPSLT